MRIIATLTLTLFLSLPTKAQWIGGQISAREKQAFEMRVKEIGQFINRFNSFDKEVASAYDVPLADSVKLLHRTRSILHLLDYEKYSEASEKEQEQARAFIQKVNTGDDKAVYLDFYDEHWYAKVQIEASFQGKATELALVLKNESTADKVSKWVIVGALANCLKLPAKDPKQFIPPNSDGTNFIGLAEALAEKEKAVSYAYKGFQPDGLSLFFAYLQLGVLEIGAVKSVNFHFLQVDGWAMVVNEFNQQQPYGSGWLISDLKPILSRESYKQEVLNITSQ